MRKVHQHIKDQMACQIKLKKVCLHAHITLTPFVFLTPWRDRWETSVRHPGPSVTSGLKALQTDYSKILLPEKHLFSASLI